MRQPFLLFVVSVFFLVSGTPVARLLPVHSQPASKNAIPEAMLRQLEKEIAEVRGLTFKTPVAAKIIPRTKDATKGVQGFYSTKDKTLYLYDDLAGAYERGVLIHEMVHALQDQHFGLAKLHQAEFGSDGELALAALIEGDATLTMIEILKKDQPKVTTMLDTTLEKAKNLRNAFLYGIGARYVKGIKDKGGWIAVNARYRFPPRSTAAILAPGLNTVDLGPGRAMGAFALIQKYAEVPEAKPLILSAAQGLIGDRVVSDGSTANVWQAAFDTPQHATRFAEAHAAFVSAKQPEYKSTGTTNSWRTADGTMLSLLTRDTRISLVEAPNEAALRTAVDRLEGTPNMEIWSAKERRAITFGELVDRLLESEIVCVGESHDNEICHRIQLQIIKALHANDSRLAVGMEMFQRPYQEHLDRFIQGATSEEEMLKATEYRTRWGYHWSLYQPIADFCRRNSVPMAALNATQEMARKISKGGFAQLSDDDKKILGPIDFHMKAHRDHWYETLAKMHGNIKVTEDQKERSYQVMTVWDDYMAASAANFQTARNIRRMVVLAGSGHIDLGFGIPQRAAKRTGGRTATVHVAPGGNWAKLSQNAPTDFVIVVR